MPGNVVLEVCVESLERAVAAERGGADRLELCADLASGGITPSAALMRAVRAHVRIPISAMIRPRPGDFCYCQEEFRAMERDICIARELGVQGIVLGIIDEAGQVDQRRTSVLVEQARPLPVTFHRAFDTCSDLPEALEAVIATGAKRVLTSGGQTRVMHGLENLAQLVALAQDRIVVIPGGGVRVSNVRQILRHTGAREIHSSLDERPAQGIRNRTRTAHRKAASSEELIEFEATVRKMRDLIDHVPAS